MSKNVCGWMEILIFDIDGHSKICLSLGLKSANIYCESVWTFIAKQKKVLLPLHDENGKWLSMGLHNDFVTENRSKMYQDLF